MNRRTLIPYLDGSRPIQGWQRLFFIPLRLLGGIYGLIQLIRVRLYRHGIFKSYRAPCPVIAIGNMTTGGTGKTPMTLMIAAYLQHQGQKVAIVSRGYGKKMAGQVTVVADHQGIQLYPPDVADEPYLLAKNLPGAIILTGPNRRPLIETAINHYGAEVILMDDGFQHLKVARDLNLLLLDATLPFANGSPLPGGLLREFSQSIRRADFTVLTRHQSNIATHKTIQKIAALSPHLQHAIAIHQPQAWVHLDTQQILPPTALSKQKAVAFCAIARPETFYQTLCDLNITVIKFYPFTDHHSFDDHDCQNLWHEAQKWQADMIVCTEKDALKLPTRATTIPLYYIKIGINILAGQDKLMAKIDESLHQGREETRKASRTTDE